MLLRTIEDYLKQTLKEPNNPLRLMTQRKSEQKQRV